MKRLKLCLIISIISNSVLAQEIDINTFKYRYQKYRGLNYMLDLSGKNVFQTDKTTDQSSLSNYVSQSQKSPGLNFGGRLSADYFQLINTDKLQQSIYVNLSVENKRTSDKNTQTTQFGNLNNQTIKSNSHNRFIDYYGNFVIDQRLYYAGNRFLYFNANLSLSKNTTGIESETEIVGQTMNAFESDVRNNHYNIQLKAGWGKGRLEYVSDAVLAGFMIEDLKRKAMINEVSNETFMNIAKAITSIRNRRFTDMRFQLIDQIEMLDSQLQLNGITSAKQARYFTTLFDNWMFATQFARSTGKRLTYYIQADQAWSDYTRVTYGTSLSKNKWYNELSNRRAGIGVEYSNSWQKGLKVQHSWGIQMSSSYNYAPFHQLREDSLETANYLKSEMNYVAESFRTVLSGTYNYLFQPNTRTYFMASASASMSYIDLMKERTNGVIIKPNNHQLNGQMHLGFNFFRFINARFYLRGGIGYQLNLGRSKSIYEYIPGVDATRKDRNTLNQIDYNLNIGYALY